MKYKGDDFYSMGWEVIDKPRQGICDLAEQLMHADTNESVVKNILQLYQIVGEHFQDEGDVKHQVYRHDITRHEPQGELFDKLIELSYIIHRDKWRQAGLGGFKQSWSTQPLLKDDLDFERYLANLKPS